jgi:hypothetical protein
MMDEDSNKKAGLNTDGGVSGGCGGVLCKDERDGDNTDGYFDKMSGMQKQAFDTLYENTLEGPCSALVTCEQNLEHINFKDVNCQQLMCWNNAAGDGGGHHDQIYDLDDYQGHMGGGMYGGPGMPLEKCEYCHSDHPQLCHSTRTTRTSSSSAPAAADNGTTRTAPNNTKCGRPQFFFLQKKPPLGTNHEDWDHVTGYPSQAGDEFRPNQRLRSTRGFPNKVNANVPWHHGGALQRISSTASAKSKTSPVRTSSFVYGASRSSRNFE